MISVKVPIIFQAALDVGQFAGFADFLILDGSGRYQVWDTKLARTPKPYYAIQLCCYAEMLAAVTGEPMFEKFGIILGNGVGTGQISHTLAPDTARRSQIASSLRSGL